MGLIRELPAALVNQIAAGEVVERPASVLKELLENSLDSGATRISVVVDTSGEGLVRVGDNGSGILREDLPRAFLRHATSKIASFEDLVRTRSMGFRGEALASIASVSRVTVETRHLSEEPGARMEIVPGADPGISSWSGPVGTTVAVRDLFFNIPVRRKYLRSPQTEQGHLTEAFQRLALGFPEIHFELSTPARKLFSLPSRDSPVLRILDLYPAISEEDLLLHERGGEDLRVTVVLLRPDRLRKDRQYQHLFINRRWIRHPALFEAITQGAMGRISRDLHAGVWAYLEIPPDRFDVNVHPTKREVRLLEGDRIFSLLRRVISEAFERFTEGGGGPLGEGSATALLPSGSLPLHAVPSSPVTEATEATPAPDTTDATEAQEKRGVSGWPASRERGDRTDSLPGRAPSASRESPDAAWGKGGKEGSPSFFREPPSPGFRGAAAPPPPFTSKKGRGAFGGGGEESDRASFREIPELLRSLPSVFSGGRPSSDALSVLSQWAGTYLVATNGEELWLVDWHTAHERINYERYRKALTEGGSGGARQNLLFPLSYRVALSVADNLDSRLEELVHLGFDLDRSGPDTFRIRAVPALLEDRDPLGALDELGQHSNNFEVPLLRADRIDEILMTLSCHRSVRKNDAIGPEDGERLIRELLKTDHPYSCPHGRPTILSLGRSAIDSWFGR